MKKLAVIVVLALVFSSQIISAQDTSCYQQKGKIVVTINQVKEFKAPADEIFSIEEMKALANGKVVTKQESKISKMIYGELEVIVEVYKYDVNYNLENDGVVKKTVSDNGSLVQAEDSTFTFFLIIFPGIFYVVLGFALRNQKGWKSVNILLVTVIFIGILPLCNIFSFFAALSIYAILFLIMFVDAKQTVNENIKALWLIMFTLVALFIFPFVNYMSSNMLGFSTEFSWSFVRSNIALNLIGIVSYEICKRTSSQSKK